jgi:outer membrane receptor protein involved in Fe transport
VSVVTDFFWIDRSNELVYIADDGSLEFQGPSRACGYEAKVSFHITRRLSFDGGATKVLNAFYRGTEPRDYVVRAPHFVAGGGLTLSSFRGWSGSLRVRAVNRYLLEAGAPPAAGHTVFDLAVSRALRRGIDLSLAIDNLTDRLYYETQNWFVSRLRSQPPVARIHATPGYPLAVTAGVAFRFGGK